MLRQLALLITIGIGANAAILPDQFGEYRRQEVSPAAVENQPVWKEFGLESAERAEYSGAGSAFTLTAYRMQDPTGAFAAFQWQRPEGAESALTSASTATGALIQYNNYLLRFEGGKPHPATLSTLYPQLPGQVRSSLPTLHEYLPRKGRIPNSEKHVLGPESLAAFEPRIPAALAGFDKGAEAQIAKYRLGGRDITLIILAYPAPQIAMERLRAFETLPGATTRRTGPMVLVVPETSQVAGVKKLVDEINYSATLTWNEEAPKATVQDAAEMILAISLLAFGLIVSALGLGVLFGGSRFLLRRIGINVADEELTTLHLSGK